MEVKISLLEATVVGFSDNLGLKRAALEDALSGKSRIPISGEYSLDCDFTQANGR